MTDMQTLTIVLIALIASCLAVSVWTLLVLSGDRSSLE
jgi:hypothetical protein